MPNGPLRPHRVCIRVTGLLYVDIPGVNAVHAEGQARAQTVFRLGMPNGGRIDRTTGQWSYPVGHRPKPVEVRLDSIENVLVVGSEELP